MEEKDSSIILIGRLLSNEIMSYTSKQESIITTSCVLLISAFVTLGVSRVQRLNMYFEQIEPTLPLITGALFGFVMMLGKHPTPILVV